MIFNSFAGAAGVVLVAALSPGSNNRGASGGSGWGRLPRLVGHWWRCLRGNRDAGRHHCGGFCRANDASFSFGRRHCGRHLPSLARTHNDAWLGEPRQRLSPASWVLWRVCIPVLEPQKLGDGSVPRCRISTNGWGNDVCLAGAHLCGDSHRMPALVGGSRSSSCRDSAHT